MRRGRVSEQGRIYLVTTVTSGRQPVFTEFHAARKCVDAIRRCDRYGHTETLCFVIMPDHMHWLVCLSGHRALSRCVGAVKAYSARLIGGRVWLAGFHDRAIRRNEDVRRVARYVVANPLRSRLVEAIGDYPHWDAAWL